MNLPTAAELFAGGGGLALGLRQGGARPVAAVELDAYAAATFSANHPDVKVLQADIRIVEGKRLLAASPTNRLDILAACPPCQGFSSLTSKYRRDDVRNELVSEVGRIAEETLPLAIMLENVPGLARRGKPILDALLGKLSKLGYTCNWDILQVANYGVPQTRRRFVMLAGLGFHIDMPRPTHSQNALGDASSWRTLRDAIAEPTEVFPLDKALAYGGFETVGWNVVRRLGKANLARLERARPGRGRGDLPTELRPDCHRKDNTGFRNTYGRMQWDRPSSTITSGCLSPSKGRFGHPDELRTISLREAATLQTFPGNYRFVGSSIDRTCSIVGNALPCLFARRITEQVVTTLRHVSPWLPEALLERREAELSRYSSKE